MASGVVAVVNAAPSTSGRYPNLGPETLVAAGIPLLDRVGDDVFREVREGDVLRLDGEALHLGDRVVARGVLQDAASVAAAMTAARAGLATQLEAFAAGTAEYLLEERDLLLDGTGVPEVRTRLEGREVLVVVRGHDSRQDLRALRPWIREHRPVLIAVDEGADVLREAGYTPDLVVGDLDSVADEVLRCGAEVVVREHRDGSAPGLLRVQELGVHAVVFPAGGTSEDVAMLLADSAGASLVVAVGTPATLEELLDRGRQGMTSTFLVRLRLGAKLVDARPSAGSTASRSRPGRCWRWCWRRSSSWRRPWRSPTSATPPGRSPATPGRRCGPGRATQEVSRDQLPLPLGQHRRGPPGPGGRDRARHLRPARPDPGGPHRRPHRGDVAEAVVDARGRPAARPGRRLRRVRSSDGPAPGARQPGRPARAAGDDARHPTRRSPSS